MSTIAGRLVLTGTMAGLCLWIVVSRAGLAQDAKRESTSLPAPEEPGQIKPAERKEASPAPSTVEPGPAPLSATPSPAGTAPAVVSHPQDSDLTVPALKSAAPAPPRALIPADDEAPVSRSDRQPLGTDDPEKDAQAFAEQNRKMAEAQLKALKEEEARLRARLQKVDSGIKRWQALLEALKQSESVSVVEGELTPVQDRPELEKAAGTFKSRPAGRSARHSRPAPPTDEVPVLLPNEAPKPR
jgi:hypothetical protein